MECVGWGAARAARSGSGGKRPEQWLALVGVPRSSPRLGWGSQTTRATDAGLPYSKPGPKTFKLQWITSIKAF